jgi:lipopolysaccharide export LptBFGC system permease protein LptF
VPKRLLAPALVAALVLSALAFLTLSPVLASAVLIGSLTLVAVAALSADWAEHPSFEEREKARSRRRREKWESRADARAKDRARFAAYQEGRARKAAREERS